MQIKTKLPGYVCLFNIDNKQYLNTYEEKWVEVATDLTYNDLEIIDISDNKPIISYKVGTFQVPSSNGKSFYDIVSDGFTITCTCTGFGFRKKCKHIDQFMFENKVL